MGNQETNKEKKLTPEQLEENRKIEAKARHEGMLASREAARPLSTRERKEKALDLLKKELESGVKSVKDQKPIQCTLEGDILYKKDKEGKDLHDKQGNLIPVLMDKVLLTSEDKKRISQQITSLEYKLENMKS